MLNDDKLYEFKKQLTGLLNTFNFDTKLNIPDWIIAEYVYNSINNLDTLLKFNEAYFSKEKYIQMTNPGYTVKIDEQPLNDSTFEYRSCKQ